MLRALRARALERIARWARARQGTDVPPLALRARRIYILPTRAGYAAGVLLFVMLVAGLNYANSLALLLTFLLAGYVLVGMHECQRTLQGLELLSVQAVEGYAGAEGVVHLRVANRARSARRALTARIAPLAAVPFEIEAGGERTVSVRERLERRGRHRIGRVELASTAPFGLFRSWAWLHLPVELIAYPRPLGNRPLPEGADGRAAARSPSLATGEDEWLSLRAYQRGDSPRSIAWKTVARGGPFLVGQYAGAAGDDYRLSYAALEPLDAEARLSQLCVWVDAIARRNAWCTLDLPQLSIPLGRGAQHRARLLRALALHGDKPA